MPDDELAIFDALLPLKYKKAQLKAAQEAASDEQADETVNEIKLYRCTDDDGTLKVIQVKNGPLYQSDLTSNDSYIIDNGVNGNTFQLVQGLSLKQSSNMGVAPKK